MGDNQPLITPQTKVADLLKDFPQLEDMLVEIAPAFKKLRNPVLRKTVARVTSLAQAARVGGISVMELIQRLRREVGQPEFTEYHLSDSPVTKEPPEWFAEGRIVKTLDARPMIESGEQPIGVVLRDLERLAGNDIYELITPFEPAPLIDKAKSRGLKIWVKSQGGGEHRTYFTKS